MYGGAAWFPAPEERNTRGDEPKRRIACPIAELWEVNATAWQVTLLFNATDDSRSACQLRDPATAMTSPGPRLGGVIVRSGDLLVLTGGWICEAPDMPTRGLRACEDDDGQYWREMRDVWTYDIAQGRWNQVASDMPGARVRYGWMPRHIATADTSRHEVTYVTHFTSSSSPSVDPIPLVCFVTRQGRDPSLWLACARPFGEAADERVTINIGAPETSVPVKLVTGAVSHGRACVWAIHVNGRAHVACVNIFEDAAAAADNATAEVNSVEWTPVAGTDSDVSSEWIAWARPVQNRTTTYLSAWIADPDTMEAWRSDVEMQAAAAVVVIVDQQPSPVESPVEEPQQPPETIPDAPAQEEPVEEEETATPVSDNDDSDVPVQSPTQAHEEPVGRGDDNAPLSADGWIDEEEEPVDPPSTAPEGQGDAPSVYDYFDPPVNMEGVVKPSMHSGQQGTAVRAKPIGALSTPADVARTTTFLAVSLSAYGLVFVIVVVVLVWATCVRTRNPESSSALSRKRL